MQRLHQHQHQHLHEHRRLQLLGWSPILLAMVATAPAADQMLANGSNGMVLSRHSVPSHFPLQTPCLPEGRFVQETALNVGVHLPVQSLSLVKMRGFFF